MKPFIYLIRSLFIVIIIVCISCKKDKNDPPTVETLEITNITDSSAFSGGNVINDGGMTVTSRGVCWSIDIKPTISDDKSVNGAGVGNYISTISGLIPGTTYYVKAYATNSEGTGYGMAMSFKTLGAAPLATTEDVSNLAPYSVTLNGRANPNQLSTVVTFEYGETLSYGLSAVASQSPVKGDTIINVSAGLTGLNPGTTYHYRLKTVNELGTAYGSDMTFKTLGQIATVTTDIASNVLYNTTILNGTVNPNYLSTTVTFEYGLTTSYGLTAEAIENPVEGSTVKTVSANLNGLMVEKTYHFRIKAVNDLGTAYSNDMTFNTSPKPTDREGNKYDVVTIGNQIWMAENLKTTLYNDGTSIPLVSDTTTWKGLVTPAYCWFLNDSLTYKEEYGALYNWYTISTGKLCPTGWHVPDDNELHTLILYLDPNAQLTYGIESDIAGGKLKETGTNHWLSPNTGATNEVGFTALPAGWRYFNGMFYYVKKDCRFWTATSSTTTKSWCRSILYDQSSVNRYENEKKDGFSVRCIKE